MRVAALRRPRVSLGVGPQMIAVLLVLGLAGAMAIQPTRQLIAQRARIAEMTQELNRTQAANEELADGVRRLRDPDYLEEEARRTLGLVRPGETSFVVLPPTKGARSEHRKERAGARPETPEPSFLERLLSLVGVI